MVHVNLPPYQTYIALPSHHTSGMNIVDGVVMVCGSWRCGEGEGATGEDGGGECFGVEVVVYVVDGVVCFALCVCWGGGGWGDEVGV